MKAQYNLNKEERSQLCKILRRYLREEAPYTEEIRREYLDTINAYERGDILKGPEQQGTREYNELSELIADALKDG